MKELEVYIRRNHIPGIEVGIFPILIGNLTYDLDNILIGAVNFPSRFNIVDVAKEQIRIKIRNNLTIF